MLLAPQKPVDLTRTIFDDVEAGVIEDARRRQRRERRIVAALTVTALVIGGLIIGFTGGGGGSGMVHNRHDRGSSPSATAHASSPVVSTVARVPPNIFTFGLLAPGVGWVANGAGFYITRDGGRSWGALSLDTYHDGRYGNVAVPGFGFSGDIGPNITAVASPTANGLIVGFDDGMASRVCHTTPAVGGGAVVISSDAGRTWQTYIMPGCALPASLSFITATAGFAQSGPLLYKTTNGARSWQRLDNLPISGRIDFTSWRDGWVLGNGLYHTTDGGRTWQQASICRGYVTQGAKVNCGLPHFFGRDGAVKAFTYDSRIRPITTLVYTTTNDGRTWSTHTLGPVPTLRHYGVSALFAPNAEDLFVFFSGGLLDKSTDGGRTWTLMPAPAIDGSLEADADFVNADYGWLQTRRGIEVTTDGGRHWMALGRQD